MIRSWSASVLVPGDDGFLDMLVIGGVDNKNVTVNTIEKINVRSRTAEMMIELDKVLAFLRRCST